MMRFMKAIISYLGLKDFAIALIGLYQLLILLLYRQKLKARLGRKKFREVKKKKVIVFPMRLNSGGTLHSGGYAIEKILLLLGVKVKGFSPWFVPSNAVYVDWQDLTFNKFRSEEFLLESCKYTSKDAEYESWTKINIHTNDISKKKVAKCFADAFGYSLDVDPTIYSGKIVEKSDANATHDGKVVSGPLLVSELQANKVYNIAIDNIDENGFATDYRLPFIGECLNFCYVKKRPEYDRFSNTNESTKMVNSSEIFTAIEMDSIEKFCRAMNLNYGELDCLRDSNTGLLYVVDVAKTPAGPPNAISKKDRLRAILEMSVAFATNFMIKS